MAIDWQKLPGDFINLRTQRRYTLAETRDLISRHLLARGYALLQEGELMTVVSTDGINTALVPRVTPEELADCLPHEYVKVSFPLDWMLAEDAAEELKPLVSKNGQLIALRTTNRIEGVDAARNLQEIQRILKQEQSTDGEDRLLREFVLQHVRAADVREKLEQLLGVAKPQQMAMSPQQQMKQQQMQMQMQQQMQQMRQQMQQKGQQLAPQRQRKELEIQVVVNEQRNSVIVQAPPDKMAIAADAVRLLDVPDPRVGSLDALVGSIRTYRLATLDPQEVVEILLETGAMDPDTRLKVDQDSRAIIVSGAPWDHLTIEKLIEKLDGSPRAFKVVRLRRRRADQVATTVENLMVGQQEDSQQNRRRPYYIDYWGGRGSEDQQSQDRFRVGADVEHNWLLLWCNDREHQQVMELLAELGEVPGGPGSAEQVRVIDSIDAATADELLRRAREVFRSLAPNPVELPVPVDPPRPTEDEEQESEPGPERNPSTKELVPTVTTERTSDLLRPKSSARSRPVLDRPVFWANPSEGFDLRDRRGGERELDEKQPTSEPPPVSVVRQPDGRILLHSRDTAALDIFEQLLSDLRPQQKEYEVFELQYASATWVVLQLEDFFDDSDEDDRNRLPFFFFMDERPDSDRPLGLADRRPIRFISDIDTNTIIVRNATEDQLRTVGELIDLYDIREPVNTEKARHTKLISIKHSKASVIASQIKDVFRDLLSGNDKAFQQQGSPEQGRQRSNSGGVFAQGLAFGDGDSEKQSDTRASFKGKLSLGIDDTTNTLLVSTEGETLMQLVVAMIDDLDQAARPADNVRVVRLQPGSDYAGIREALRETFGDSNVSVKGDQPEGKPQPPGTADAQKPPRSRPEKARRPFGRRIDDFGSPFVARWSLRGVGYRISYGQNLELLADLGRVRVRQVRSLNQQHVDALGYGINPPLCSKRAPMSKRAWRKHARHSLWFADDAPAKSPAIPGRETGLQVVRLATGHLSDGFGRDDSLAAPSPLIEYHLVETEQVTCVGHEPTGWVGSDHRRKVDDKIRSGNERFRFGPRLVKGSDPANLPLSRKESRVLHAHRLKDSLGEKRL